MSHRDNESFEVYRLEIKRGGTVGPPFILLKEQAIELLQKFDLGDAYFTPVALYQWDRTTPVDLKVSTMCIGNPKKTVRQDQTPLIEVVPGKSGLKRAPTLWGDDHIITRADALDGPDLWVDPEFRDMWCLSDRLAQALIQAGLKDTLDLVRTKTV